MKPVALRRPLLVYFIVSLLGLAIIYAALLRKPEALSAPNVAMRSLDGEPVSFEALRDKVVLVNFWATDCTVCLQEMPSMIDTYERYRSRGMEAVFIAMPYDRPDRVLHYARSHKLPFKVVLDVQGEINRGFGDVRATPTTFVIDKRGHVVERILGKPDFVRLQRLIETKLGEET